MLGKNKLITRVTELKNKEGLMIKDSSLIPDILNENYINMTKNVNQKIENKTSDLENMPIKSQTNIGLRRDSLYLQLTDKYEIYNVIDKLRDKKVTNDNFSKIRGDC